MKYVAFILTCLIAIPAMAGDPIPYQQVCPPQIVTEMVPVHRTVYDQVQETVEVTRTRLVPEQYTEQVTVTKRVPRQVTEMVERQYQLVPVQACPVAVKSVATVAVVRPFARMRERWRNRARLRFVRPAGYVAACPTAAGYGTSKH